MLSQTGKMYDFGKKVSLKNTFFSSNCNVNSLREMGLLQEEKKGVTSMDGLVGKCIDQLLLRIIFVQKTGTFQR